SGLASGSRLASPAPVWAARTRRRSRRPWSSPRPSSCGPHWASGRANRAIPARPRPVQALAPLGVGPPWLTGRPRLRFWLRTRPAFPQADEALPGPPGVGHDGDRVDRADGGQPGPLASVIAVGLPLEPRPLPGIAGGAGHAGGAVELRAQVVDPAGRRARLAHPPGEWLSGELAAQLVGRGGRSGTARCGRRGRTSRARG